MPATTPPNTKPVRVDLSPMVHKQLRMAAAAQEMSMASFARKLITEALSGKKGSAK